MVLASVPPWPHTAPTMAPRPRKAPAPSARARKAPPRPVDVDRLVIRGLSPEDLAALDAATVDTLRRLSAVTSRATVSRNAVALDLLRRALDPFRGAAPVEAPEGSEGQ